MDSIVIWYIMLSLPDLASDLYFHSYRKDQHRPATTTAFRIYAGFFLLVLMRSAIS